MRPIPTAALLFVLSLAACPAHAAESYDNCSNTVASLPAVISTQGVWCLKTDLATGIGSGNAITVTANNVTLDCNGFKLGGLSAGLATQAVGIYAQGSNLVVRNCNIRGFQVGLHAPNGSGHMIENNRFEGNTHYGIVLNAPGSAARGNQVMDTGGSTAGVADAAGIGVAYGVDVIDNTINGVNANTDGNSYGIYTSGNSDGSIVGNRIRGLSVPGPGVNIGISGTFSGRMTIVGNHVQAETGDGFYAILCEDSRATSRDNIIGGYLVGVVNCHSANDTVNPN